MKLSDIKYKCDYCSVRSCGKRGRKLYNGKDLSGVIVGCASWRPSRHAISLIFPTIF